MAAPRLNASSSINDSTVFFSIVQSSKNMLMHPGSASSGRRLTTSRDNGKKVSFQHLNVLLCSRGQASRFQRRDSRRVEDGAIRRELRSMARAVPALLSGIPVHMAAEMRADRRNQIE